MANKTDKNSIDNSMDNRYSDCVIKLLEAGKSVDEICGAFPEYEPQIRKFCELFASDKVAEDKTRSQESHSRGPAGAPNFGLFDPVRFIISNRKTLVVAAAVFVLLVTVNAAWLAAHSGSRSIKQTDQGNLPAANATSTSEAQNIMATEGDQSTSALPEPTGNVDDAAAAVNNFINQEDNSISGEDADTKLIGFDNAAIDNFGTIYPQTLGSATCSNIKGLAALAAKNTSDRQSSLAVAQAGRLNNIIGGRNSRDNHLEAQRSATDSQLKRVYDKMNLVAEGGAQKQGVLDFSNTIGAAIATRRAAIDAAQSAFRSGLDQLLQQRMINVKSASDALIAAGNSSLSQASQNCQNLGNAQASLLQLQSALNSALQNFNAAKSSIESQNGDPLAGARDAAIKSANDAFSGAVQKSVLNLKSLQF